MAFVNASGKDGILKRGEIPPWEQIREERIMFD